MVVECALLLLIVLCVTSSYMRAGGDKDTSELPLSVEQAKLAARAWCGEPELDLVFKSVYRPTNDDLPPEIVLDSVDCIQKFHICTSTAEIRRWTNLPLQRIAWDRKDADEDESTLLPISELDSVARSFLRERCPGFEAHDMRVNDAWEGYSAYYCEHLSNGVRNSFRKAFCIVDEYTGDVYRYLAPLALDIPESVELKVQAEEAEQIAMEHVLGRPVLSKFAKAFIRTNFGAVIQSTRDDRVEFSWELLVGVHATDPDYTVADYMNHLKTGAVKRMVKVGVFHVRVDAQKGNIIRCEPFFDDEYVPPSVAIPTFTPVAGTYGQEQDVTIACPEPGATIRYTTDGSNPMPTSKLYTGPITVTGSHTLKARAYKKGFRSSLVGTAKYTIER